MSPVESKSLLLSTARVSRADLRTADEGAQHPLDYSALSAAL